MHFSAFVPVFPPNHAHSLDATVTRSGGSDDDFTSCFKSKWKLEFVAHRNRGAENIYTIYRMYASKRLTKIHLFHCCKMWFVGEIGLKKQLFFFLKLNIYHKVVVSRLGKREGWHWLLYIITTEIYKKHNDSILTLRFFFPQTCTTLTYLLSPTSSSPRQCLLSLCLSRRLSESFHLPSAPLHHK